MAIFLLGMSHRTAPVELRERLAFGPSELPEALSSLVDREAIGEASIVSTCNRIEVVAAGAEPGPGFSRIQAFLSEWGGVDGGTLAPHLYQRRDREAIHHLFRVAASLDSLVLGEPQILGQVRDAYRQGIEAGTVGRQLGPLFQRAFAVAKRVRTETGVGTSAVSVSYAAVELGRKIFDSLKGKTVLLLGAGEMAELAARHFVDVGASRILVANRTFEHAHELADRFGAAVVPFDQLDNWVADADIVLCSTAAPGYILGPDNLRRAREERRNRPLFLIDISVPRQIDPAAGALANVFLFDMDDLHRAVEANRREREREAATAETIVEGEVADFLGRLQTADIGPTVAELKGRLNDVALGEFDRLRRRLGELTPVQEEAIKSVLLPSIINKIAHPMIAHMRDSARDVGNAEESVSIWRRIFRLGGEGD
jgi:glutamyl-tRNA reductase